jgi:hypothetical protein
MKTKEQIKKEKESCHVYTLYEFAELVINNYITPYDGYGYFHNGEKETDKEVFNKDYFSSEDFELYPYICWYNK